MKNLAWMVCALWLVALCGPARAGGFLIYEHGGTGTGMCGARTASSDDPGAMYFNPAAITELDGVQLQLGTTLILGNSSYDPAGRPTQPRLFNTFDAEGNPVEEVVNDGENPAKQKVMLFTPVHLYATWRVRDLPLAIGYGLTNPFGLGSYWPGDWDGRFIATESEMRSFFNNPVVALDVADLAGFKDKVKLSVAAGYMLVYGQAKLARRIDLRAAEAFTHGQLQDPWGEMRLNGDAWGHGWNVAVYAELPRLLAFGFSLRSHVSLPFSGTADFLFPGTTNQQAREYLESIGTVFPDSTTGSVTIDLPLHLNTGVAFLGIEKLKLAADFFLAFFESFEELKVSFSCVDEGTCSSILNQAIPKRWKASWQVSLGAEYYLLDRLPLRAGWGIVGNPVPADTYDPSLADGQRQLITAGTGWHGSWWKFDIGYMMAFWKGTKNNDVGGGDGLNPEGRANGTYTTYSHLLGLTFAAKL